MLLLVPPPRDPRRYDNTIEPAAPQTLMSAPDGPSPATGVRLYAVAGFRAERERRAHLAASLFPGFAAHSYIVQPDHRLTSFPIPECKVPRFMNTGPGPPAPPRELRSGPGDHCLIVGHTSFDPTGTPRY